MWNQLITFIQDQLQNNDLFKGGILLMVGGALLAFARTWPLYIWNFIKRQSMVSLDIPDKDQAFKWVDDWLANHPYSQKRARSLTVHSTRVKSYEDEVDCHIPKIMFSPAPGYHYLWYKRRLMILRRNRQSGQGSDTSAQDPFREYFTIKILGRNRDIALELINDAYKFHNPSEFKRVIVYRTHRFGTWEAVSWMPEREFESVILPEGTSELIVDHIQNFIDSEEWYLKQGIPYRTGCLYEGPTGNGKTTSIIALASHFGYDLGILNLKSKGLTDEDLAHALSNPPPKCFIVLEDIDCVTEGREVKGAVSFSGLLNALDGIGAAHNQIIFMTTNHVEVLDSALIRPGRCDLRVEFPNATPYQKANLFERFFPDAGLALDFAKKAKGDLSMATLEEHMMKYRDSSKEAFENATHIGKVT